MNKNYFKILNVPAMPDNIADQLTIAANHAKHSRPDITWASQDTAYDQRTIIKDGITLRSTRSHHGDLPESVKDWIRIHVIPNWLYCNLVVTPPTSHIHGAHTDKTRRYILIYMIETGGDNVTSRWYQEKGFPLYRTEKQHVLIENYDKHDLIELAQYVVQPGTWIAFDGKILHDVQNITDNRVAIHIGIDETFDLKTWQYSS